MYSFLFWAKAGKGNGVSPTWCPSLVVVALLIGAFGRVIMCIPLSSNFRKPSSPFFFWTSFWQSPRPGGDAKKKLCGAVGRISAFPFWLWFGPAIPRRRPDFEYRLCIFPKGFSIRKKVFWRFGLSPPSSLVKLGFSRSATTAPFSLRIHGLIRLTKSRFPLRPCCL